MIDWRARGLVDDHDRVSKIARLQMVPQPARLAGAKKSAEHRKDKTWRPEVHEAMAVRS
jgi:hypothetical protein